jgi:hypothetical protein
MCTFISKCVNTNKLPTKPNQTKPASIMQFMVGAGEGIKGVCHSAPQEKKPCYLSFNKTLKYKTQNRVPQKFRQNLNYPFPNISNSVRLCFCLSAAIRLQHAILNRCIDEHGLKIHWRGYLMFLGKIPRGVKAFRKNCQGVPLFRVLLRFY